MINVISAIALLQKRIKAESTVERCNKEINRLITEMAPQEREVWIEQSTRILSEVR